MPRDCVLSGKRIMVVFLKHADYRLEQWHVENDCVGIHRVQFETNNEWIPLETTCPCPVRKGSYGLKPPQSLMSWHRGAKTVQMLSPEFWLVCGRDPPVHVNKTPAPSEFSLFLSHPSWSVTGLNCCWKLLAAGSCMQLTIFLNLAVEPDTYGISKSNTNLSGEKYTGILTVWAKVKIDVYCVPILKNVAVI